MPRPKPTLLVAKSTFPPNCSGSARDVPPECLNVGSEEADPDVTGLDVVAAGAAVAAGAGSQSRALM